MIKRIFLFSLFSIIACHVVAQQKSAAAVPPLAISDTDIGKQYYGSRTDPPRAIEFKERTVSATTLLAKINQYLAIPEKFTFEIVESTSDNLGMRHHLLQQYYLGIPVEGLAYKVHEKNGFVTSANGRAVREIQADLQTLISEEQAFRLAVQHTQARDSVFKGCKKWIVSKNFTFSPESFTVAYLFEIDKSLAEHWRISIDARTGEVVNKINLVNTCFDDKQPPLPYTTGKGMTNYYGERSIRVEKQGDGSRLFGQTEHGGLIQTLNFANVNILSLLWFYEWAKFYEFSSSSTEYNSEYVKPAVSAHWAAEQAYEYYFKEHTRNSYDNNGSTIKNVVHVDVNMNNAFWTHNLLAYGDGSNNNPLVELDVVGHELTHGVTQYEAQLNYYGEPGALNESFSDIFGKSIDFYTFGDTATWQLGKHYRAGGLRDMSNPNLKNQPDTYKGDQWYSGYEDSGGVHTNSGVQNFWYYLLCEGGSGVNDHQMSYAVNAIGIQAASKIVYRNLTEYLSYSADYLDSRIGSLLATADLYGKNSATYQEVDKAWDAVGVIDEPIITSLKLYDITATTVKIKGSLEPRGNTVTYHFEYGTTAALGSSSSVYEYKGDVHGILTGLQSATKYFVKLVATNENGNSYMSTEFTTTSLAPMVKIKQTVDLTETSATLYGRINPNSLATSFYFEYGTTPDLGMVTPVYYLKDTTEFLDVSASISNLLPRHQYYYKLVATNSFASSATDQVSFFTAVKPIIQAISPVTAAPGAVVTISGSNFNSLQDNNLVNFGATRATLISSSPTELKAIVPAGASFGVVTLLDAESGLSAVSTQEFVPTFTGVFIKNSLQRRVGVNDIRITKTMVSDMDGDGKPDIVALHYSGFSVFQNVNDGGAITDQSFIRNTQNTEYSIQNFALADMDGNGQSDIVCSYQDKIRIYSNLSVPGYISFGVPVDIPTGYVRDFVINDFDGDGHIDIACAKSPGDSSTIIIIRNQNPKGFLVAENFIQRNLLILPYGIFFLSSGDLNNDGLIDLVTNGYDKDYFSILKNSSYPGSLQFNEMKISDATRARFPKYRASDLNGDGRKDVIGQAYYSTGSLSAFENINISPDLVFENPIVLESNGKENAVEIGDINGDGKVDVLFGNNNRVFIPFTNVGGNGEHLSANTFEKAGEFGFPSGDVNAGYVATMQMSMNDLNADGRPEVINSYSYYYAPHDGFQMEIWQNTPYDCLSPSLINFDVFNYYAIIVLPPNTKRDQFEIEYTRTNYNYWMSADLTTLPNLSPGTQYTVRIRAKCYLGFTEYEYKTFTTDCVDVDGFSVQNIGVNEVKLKALNNLDMYEIQYALAGTNYWSYVPQPYNQITNLTPGTAYDLRFRGRCNTLTDFKYRKFTTLCPKLTAITITELTYNRAVVSWTSNYSGNVLLEYSDDKVSWKPLDSNRTLFPLVIQHTYYVRAKMLCTNSESEYISTSFITPCPKVSIRMADQVTPFSARINWTDPSETGTYTLTYYASSGGPSSTVELKSSFYELKGLAPGTSYTVSVAPYCSGAKDFQSISFTTLCYGPFQLQEKNVTHTTAELIWSESYSGVPYVVDYAIVNSNKWFTSTSTSTTTVLNNLRPGTEYEVKVHIHCTNLDAPVATLRLTTRLYEETTFAPNPTDGKITIQPSISLIGHNYCIYDYVGNKLVFGVLNNYTLDLSALLPGMYLLKIDGERTMKINKQ